MKAPRRPRRVVVEPFFIRMFAALYLGLAGAVYVNMIVETHNTYGACRSMLYLVTPRPHRRSLLVQSRPWRAMGNLGVVWQPARVGATSKNKRRITIDVTRSMHHSTQIL
eukprot:scaffold103129_cov35-Tisochrysis_lutea.AAC.3